MAEITTEANAPFDEFGQPPMRTQTTSLSAAILVVTSLVSPLSYLLCFSLVLYSMMPETTGTGRQSAPPPQAPKRHPLDDE